MREFEKQIQKYQAQLPHMREKVVAAASLLLVAIIVMVSTSYAWVVLSARPEIAGISTTITANGNLEIALATGDEITEPAPVAVGDGKKELVYKNITWGNLINLADESYGLENMVLRPATLNTNALRESPLYAADYNNDGRVDELDSNFAFAGWDPTTQKFLADKVPYGVRTIASVTYGEAGGDLALAALDESAKKKIGVAQEDLRNIATADEIDDLGVLMQQYVQAMVDEKLGSSAKEIRIDPDNLEAIYRLMVRLHDNMELIADAMAETYNIQLLRRMGNAYYENNKFTGVELLTQSMTNIDAKMNVKNAAGEKAVVPHNKTWLNTLRSRYASLASDIDTINALRGRTDVIWENLESTPEDQKKPEIYPVVNRVVTIGTATIDGVPLNQLGYDAMMDLLGKSNISVEAQSGYLKDVDQLSGTRFVSKSISLSVKALFVTKDVSGTVTTYASNPKNTEKYALSTEYSTALSGATNYKGSDPIAGDTFGLAIDFFLRTNASQTHVVLEGSPEYEERIEQVTGIVDGNKVDLYNVTVGDNTYTAYKSGNNYYRYDEKTQMAGDQITNVESATLKTELVKYVIGYNGSNRIWDADGNAHLTADSTTQGSGSCYVFYYEAAEDKQKALQLLDHMRIAFIDEQGTLLTTAQMDTKNIFEEVGKVTVPIVLSSTSPTVDGPAGEKIYTITELQKNQATFITALVYLEGTGLTNDQVLASNEIQGQLNIQFGSTTELTAVEDPFLVDEQCTVSATMEGATEVDFNTATEADLTKTITVMVNGTEPGKVEAYFQRVINNTQGVRADKLTFTKQGDGRWTVDAKFTKPGTYILREVLLDGIGYELDSAPITFTVNGFAIASVSCNDNNKTFMTADKQFETTVSLTFAGDAGARMPGTVKGVFIHKETGNRTTVYFAQTNGTTWTGKAQFLTSGTYYMDHVELDDAPNGLQDSQKLTINLLLGLRTRVYAGINTTFEFNGTGHTIPMSVAIESDDGTKIENLSNVWLYYAHSGSTLIENGLSAEVVWNAETKYYEGEFLLRTPGIYNFSHVTVSSGNVNNTFAMATTAPAITAIPKEPPSYESKDCFDSHFALNNDATFSIRLNEAASATVDAELINTATGKSYYVRGVAQTVDGNANARDFVFTIPIINGVQTGTWKLTNIYVTNVANADGDMITGSTEDGPTAAGTFADTNMTGETYYADWWKWTSGKIGGEATMSVTSGVDWSFVSTGLNEQTGAFNGQYSLDDIVMNITTGGMSPAEAGVNVTVKLNYTYVDEGVVSGDNVKNNYGHYTVSSADWATIKNATLSTPLSFEYNSNIGSANGKQFTLHTNQTVSTAGKYMPTSITLTLSRADGASTTIEKVYNESNKAEFNCPIYTISYVKPDLQWTGVSDTSSSNQFTAYRAEVYFRRKGSKYTGTYSASSATLALMNDHAFGSSFTDVTAFFDGTESDVTYELTPSALQQSQRVGSVLGIGMARKIWEVGTVTISQVSVTATTGSQSITYTVDLNQAITLYGPSGEKTS